MPTLVETNTSCPWLRSVLPKTGYLAANIELPLQQQPDFKEARDRCRRTGRPELQ